MFSDGVVGPPETRKIGGALADPCRCRLKRHLLTLILRVPTGIHFSHSSLRDIYPESK